MRVENSQGQDQDQNSKANVVAPDEKKKKSES